MMVMMSQSMFYHTAFPPSLFLSQKTDLLGKWVCCTITYITVQLEFTGVRLYPTPATKRGAA